MNTKERSVLYSLQIVLAIISGMFLITTFIISPAWVQFAILCWATMETAKIAGQMRK